MFHRVGSCNNCGCCCTFYTPLGDLVCKEYDPKNKLHCKIYSKRPQKCKLYPQRPADVAGHHPCGFSFVDDLGRVIDPYRDPVYISRLTRLSSILKK